MGKTIVVCGRVVEEGEQPCPSCAYGAYSYLVLEGGFNIISYYWNFVSYDNACLIASDKVEQLGTHPVFVYGAKEGSPGASARASRTAASPAPRATTSFLMTAAIDPKGRRKPALSPHNSEAPPLTY